MSSTYQDDEKFALRLARQAGEIIRERWHERPLGEIELKGPHNPVTVTDRESEAFIVTALRRDRPNDGILAEENERSGLHSQRIWIVDPLDGTVNFTRSHPFVAVSIALVLAGQPVAGAVHLPMLDESYSASFGGGARRYRRGSPGERIRVSSTHHLGEALLATGFPYVRDHSPFNNLPTFNRMFSEVRGLRRCGVASIDLAFVAAGIYDGYWEPHLEPHDVAAGALLVLEAGGLVSDFGGKTDWLYGRNIVASNHVLHSALLEKMPIGFDPDIRGIPGALG